MSLWDMCVSYFPIIGFRRSVIRDFKEGTQELNLGATPLRGLRDNLMELVA
jgi:hypothetical protein